MLLIGRFEVGFALRYFSLPYAAWDTSGGYVYGIVSLGCSAGSREDNSADLMPEDIRNGNCADDSNS